MSDNIKNNERFTIKSTPPNLCKPQRRSYWPTVFAEARECPGEWVRTDKWFLRATAAQVASDLRNGHRRSPAKMRVSGFLPGDRWETRWGNDTTDLDAEHCYIWLRFDGISPVEDRRVLEEAAW